MRHSANSMKKLSSYGRVLSHFCLSSSSTKDTSSFSSCLCFRTEYASSDDDKPLIAYNEVNSSSNKLKDVLAGPPTLALQLKPKMVVMKVSMHCNGCARRVKKHITKLEGVTSYKIDMETKMVVVIGDIVPFEILQSVSKVKTAQFWDDHYVI